MTKPTGIVRIAPSPPILLRLAAAFNQAYLGIAHMTPLIQVHAGRLGWRGKRQPSRYLYAILAALAICAFGAEPALSQAIQVPNGEQCFGGITTGLTGSIQTTTGLNGGGGGTDGTYTNVPLLGGSGQNATANITVVGGTVTGVVISNPGTNYATNDVLYASNSNIGGTLGFSVIVASTQIASNMAGGSVAMYIPGTLTFAQTWQNASQTIQNTNPIVLNSNGCATIYGVGTYRQILLDNLGNKVWDQLTSVPPTNPYWAGLVGGTANAITLTDAQFTATDGQAIQFLAAFTNTGPTTLTVNYTGGSYTYPIYKNSSLGPVALTGGEITANNVEDVTYSALIGGFVLTSPIYAPSTIFYSFGQVRFSAQSTSTVAVTPYGGNLVTIAGTNYSIPSAGVTANINTCYVNGAAGQTLSASTLYYVYLWNNGGVLTLNFSTTGHVTDTTTGNIGVEIMSGNNHYTLVGMVYPTAGPTLSYTGANQLVLSWFNRQKLDASASFTITRTTTSTTLAEINTEIRDQVLVWSNSPLVTTSFLSSTQPTGGAISTVTQLAVDGTVAGTSRTTGINGAAGPALLTIVEDLSITTEGYHYITVFGSCPNTGNWYVPSVLQVGTNG